VNPHTLSPVGLIRRGKMKHIFLNLWHGNAPLWKTFWLYGVAALIIIPQVFTIPMGIIAWFSKVSDGTFLFLISPLLIAYIAYGIFLTISTWRSADRYQGQIIWSRLAKVTMTALVIIVIVLNGYSLIKEVKSIANQGPVRLP